MWLFILENSFFHGLAFLDHKRQIFKSKKSHVEKLNSCQHFVNFRMNHGIPAINFSGLMYAYILTFKNQQNVKIILKKSAIGGNNNGFIWHQNPFSYVIWDLTMEVWHKGLSLNNIQALRRSGYIWKAYMRPKFGSQLGISPDNLQYNMVRQWDEGMIVLLSDGPMFILIDWK